MAIIGDKYQIESVIASGGDGVIYHAVSTDDSGSREDFAVKEFFPRGYAVRDAGGALMPKSKRYEAAYVSGLNHFRRVAKALQLAEEIEGVVRVYDCIDANNTSYMVMEHIDGQTLREYMKSSPVTSDQILQLLRALRNLAAIGIIHRDISPDNIMISETGQLYLMDFGCSVLEGDTVIPTGMRRKYAAPERVENPLIHNIEADIYSLGVVLGEIAKASNGSDKILQELANRCTAAKPADRFSDYNKIINFIEENYGGTI